MLFVLKFILSIIIVVATIFYGVCTANEDLDWASDLSQKSTAMVWQSLKEIFVQATQLETGSEPNLPNTTLTKQESELYVFVSTSMPKLYLRPTHLKLKNMAGY